MFQQWLVPTTLELVKPVLTAEEAKESAERK
jgi:hypothetical protein